MNESHLVAMNRLASKLQDFVNSLPASIRNAVASEITADIQAIRQGLEAKASTEESKQ